jgi:hypothetical protein
VFCSHDYKDFRVGTAPGCFGGDFLIWTPVKEAASRFHGWPETAALRHDAESFPANRGRRNFNFVKTDDVDACSNAGANSDGAVRREEGELLLHAVRVRMVWHFHPARTGLTVLIPNIKPRLPCPCIELEHSWFVVTLWGHHDFITPTRTRGRGFRRKAREGKQTDQGNA